ADGGVVVVFGGDGRDDEIVGVVAALEENADKGLGVGRPDVGLRDGGVHEAQVADGRGHGGGADGGARGAADEFTARDGGNIFRLHKLFLDGVIGRVDDEMNQGGHA